MNQQPLPAEELCPNCGEWCVDFEESLGWCVECAVARHPSGKICIDCKAIFQDNSGNLRCWSCKEEHWLTKYADLIEAYMSVGYSYTGARTQVEIDIRPKCLSCGGLIKSAKPGSLFCNENIECSRIRYLYKRHRFRKNLTQHEALTLLSLQFGKSFT